MGSDWSGTNRGKNNTARLITVEAVASARANQLFAPLFGPFCLKVSVEPCFCILDKADSMFPAITLI